MRITTNSTILSVKTRSGQNRYGEPQWEVVDSLFQARLLKRARVTYSREGVVGVVDADMIVPPTFDFREGDRVTIDDDNETQYNIVSTDDLHTTAGAVSARRYGLVRIQDDIR